MLGRRESVLIGTHVGIDVWWQGAAECACKARVWGQHEGAHVQQAEDATLLALGFTGFLCERVVGGLGDNDAAVGVAHYEHVLAFAVDESTELVTDALCVLHKTDL